MLRGAFATICEGLPISGADGGGALVARVCASVCATATMSNRNRAVAASEASETDESKAERLAAGRARHEVRNRISRLVAFVLCGALLFGVWSASTAQNETWSTSKLYLPSAGLELTVSGCDVAFVASASPTLTYAARASVYSAEFSYDATDSSIVRSATLINRDGSCEAVPYSDCGKLCKITVAVTSDQAAFQIWQDSTDLSHPRLTVADGVAMASLTVKRTAPSLSVTLEPGAAVAAVHVDLNRGSLSIDAAASLLVVGGVVRRGGGEL